MGTNGPPEWDTVGYREVELKPGRIGTLRLVEMLGEWWSGTGPLYRQLADALKTCVDHGDIRPGTKLPSERTLASTLAVSRTTVVAAFEELKRVGYLDSSPGSGTWVRALRGFNPAGGILTPPDTVGRNPLFARLGSDSNQVVDFTTAVLGPSEKVAATVRAASHKVDTVLDGPGYFPAGLPLLSEMVSQWFTGRGVPTNPEQILITSGGQQAIMLIAAAHIQPGDSVLLESPTYPGALDAFRLVGASIRTVLIDDPTQRGTDLLNVFGSAKPKVAYLIPTFHNPTGSVLEQFDRVRLCRHVAGGPTLLVEDESLVELGLDSYPATPKPLAAHHPGVLTIGSASKPFWGGLRIGWIRGPADTIRRLVHYKTVMDLATAATTQMVAVELLRNRDQLIDDRRRQLRSQSGVLVDALHSYLPSWRWTQPAGGLSLWVGMPSGSATEFAQVALRHGVALVPGPFFDPHGLHDLFLRLPYVLPETTLALGVQRLASAWEQYRGGTRQAHDQPA